MHISMTDNRCLGAAMPAGSSRSSSSHPTVSAHMLIFTGHSRKWRWQARFEVEVGGRGAKGQALPADMKARPSAPCSSYLSCTPLDHLYLHNLGLIGPKQKPCVNYLWRCNGFRAAANLHLVSKWGPGNRLRFRHVAVVLSPLYLSAWRAFILVG